MLKVELHAHTDADPADRILHSTEALILHAAALGYGALAVTLHDRYFDPAPYVAFASAQGVTLLSGIERTIEGRHLLLINFPPAIVGARSFEEVGRVKAATGGLVVAPHPFYPLPSAVGTRLDRHAALVDAVEVNAMYTRAIDFNRRARRWAADHGKPLVGNTDLHFLGQMGTTYSLVEAPPDPAAICAAIRAGRVTVRSVPLSTPRAAHAFLRLLESGVHGWLRARSRP